MLDDPADTIGAALLKLGHPVNSVDPGHLAQARGELIEQKRIVLAYMNVETRTHLLSGDVHAAHNWATNILFAVDQGSPTTFAFPREGFSMYCDSAAILRESRRADLAHHFLNFLMRPEIAARGSSALNACPVTKSAFALMPEAKRNSPVLNPSAEVLLRGQWLEALPAAGQRLRDRIWTEVKSA
jgi:spermidine/putrescine transport system substrate-binding protein